MRALLASSMVWRKASASGDTLLFAADAEARWQYSNTYFQVKNPVSKDAEIIVANLNAKAHKLFTGAGGSREKEWQNMANAFTPDGGPAVRVHRGAKARELREKVFAPYNSFSLAREMEGHERRI